MSMTKTGIIGLVVLIVILIGGYSIVTQTDSDLTLGDNATTTDETANGTTTDEVATDTNETVTNEGQTDENQDETVANTDEEGQTENTEDETQTSGPTDEEGAGTNGMGGTSEDLYTETTQYHIPTEIYANEDLGVALKLPETWNVETIEDPEDGQVQLVAGEDFAAGKKAEMTVTRYEDATVRIADLDEGEEIVLGQKYEVELECKGEDLDCAGGSFIIPVEGEMTDDGFEGTVIQVSFGVYEMPNYDGPDTGVDVNELLGVTASTFGGAVSSMSVSGVGGASGFAGAAGVSMGAMGGTGT